MSLLQNETLSVKIVTADYYMYKPIPEFGDQCYSAFKSSPIYRVPVIRIFGPTLEGVKTCVHIHGVFPYIFVPNWNNEISDKDLYNFAVHLDKAINTSFAHSNSKSSHVHKITKVSGIPFYGYHECEKNFLKIEFYNPAMVKRASDLLLNGAVLNTIFQPHEAHIPYILQFFIDNNLYGMNNITFSSYKIRKKYSQDDLNLNETIIQSSNDTSQQSYSKLEVDIIASNLCSTLTNEENIPNNPGLAFIWEDEKKRRRFNQKSSQITPNESQQRPEKPITRTELYFREKLLQKLQSIKDNETRMEIENEETPSLNSTYEELNTQSRSLLALLEDLAGQAKKNDVLKSGSSSPSLVYSDDEVANVADISSISSQPVLKFNAEDDSILGNNFSDDENDIDDNDHKTLSQSIIYLRHNHTSSSDDSESESNIPQLDGACDTKTPNKSKSKKSTNAKNKITKSRKEIIKVSKNNQSQDNLGDEKIYNLRSRNKPGEKSKPTENFQPKDFKIILSRLDTKFSPRKTYPRLNIDTQKSPRSNSSKSFSDENDNSSFKTTISNVRNESLPSLPENQSIKVSKSADNSGILKNDKVSFPQLQINVKKSPRSYHALRKSNLEPSSTILHGLKKRKINFGSEENDTKSKEPGGDMDLMSVKWKKSLKRRKKDETCFKIGQSFSLLEFRDSKRDHNVDGKLTDDIELTGINYLPDSREISSQSYSLRVRGTKSFDVYCDSTEKSIDVDDESGEMESLQIPESDTINDKNVDKSANIDDFEKTRELEMPPKSDFSFPKNPSTSGSQSRGGTLKIPILRIPRLQMDKKSVTVSPPLYENSFIELDVFKSNGENTNTMVDLATSQRPSLAVKKQEDLKNSQQLNMENNCVKSEKSKKPTSPDIEVTATPQKRLFVETKKAEENSVKAAKNQASKKKCLGMRIRKNLKSKTSQIEDPISILPPIYHDYQAEKLPETLVNSEIGRTVDNRNIPASQEPYPDSFIELNISKSNVESLPKNNHDIKGKSPLISNSSVQSKDEKTKDLPSIVNNENSCIENSEIELDILKYCSKPTKDITKEDTELSKSVGNVVREKSLISDSSIQSKDEKAKDVPRVINDENSFFENSNLELDIFKHCSILVDEITKENTSRSKFTGNVDLATSRIPESNESEHENENEKVSFTPSNDHDFCNQECLLRQNYIHNENMAAPQSSLCDKFPAEKNHKSFHSSVNNTDTSSNQEITLDQKHKQNENLATSQSFSHVVLTKCENVSVMEDAEMFCDEELLLLEPEVVENRNLASSQTMLDKNTALDENMGLSEYLGSDYETLFSQETPYTRDHKNTKSLATSQSFLSVASNKFDKSTDIPTECGTRDDDISSKIDTNNEDAATSQQSCSNDSLLNVLDALSPRTREALNKKLDLTESSPDFQNDVINRSSSHLNDNVGSTNLATLPIPQHSKKSNTSEDFHSQNSPNILDKSRYNDEHSVQPSQEILFDEDSLRLEIPSTSRDSRPRSNSPVKKPTLEKLLLNNSIWDSIDSDHSSDEDNEIQSFYHNQTINPAHITVIRDIAEDDSSPMAKSLTPESVSNEILSFYGSQSPDSMICSIGEDLNVVSKSSNESDSSQGSRKRSTESVSPVKLHSTPTTSSAKKSPSPVYTPILKKLMIKTVSKAKRRISSQRFRAEPFLPEIKEEEEKQIKRDANTTLSLPLELECDTSKIGKSLNTSRTSTCSGASYQIDGATLENSCGFKMNLENLQDIKTDKQFQFITQMSLEIFAVTRGNLRPDPEYDAVTCLFYSIHHDAPDFANLTSGIIIVDVDPLPLDVNRFKCDKTLVSTESQLFDEFLALVRKWDPDMLIGYEVEMLSWGFLIQRGYHLGRNLSQELSRVRVTKQNEPLERPTYEDDEYSNEIKLPGRIVLNVWRLMRHEVNLQSYTFENILFHVLHQRAPYHTFKFLTECWKNASKKWIVIDYFLFRTESNITLLEQLDFICRTSELARLFGIQFYEVLSRGSQFRVESMMLRLAKTQNYVAVSPSVRQRANMRAPESLPLIMEPESKFYTDPVVVLDFQSLYPSIIIAYNYCFSTCLGRIDSLGQNEPFHFGCIEHTIAADLLLKLEPHLNLSPAGVAFVDKTIRKGILPSMLEEILETRLMVKKSMKENKNNSILKRVLHARQLGLKLIANVTYGYTSANFSGRMPCMEIADSVVSKGRETLERAIELVNSTENWGARVVYGDTDSLFVLVPNRSKEEAFRIGAEIADAVTSQNPKPVKLKLEKVYSASVLQTKKRYVGYMYESADQEKPTYDAKGIETVRRDGCPAVSKILEKSLKLLFETKNVNTVKQYVQRQFTKLICGRISIQELTFAREYRGMSNYKPAACVPALQLAKQALLKDRRSEPRIKERVRYVIISGAPGVPLIRLVRTPEEFLDTPGSLINTEYYITRVIIPALDRCFTLLKVNVHTWYTELPKKQRLNLPIDYEFRNKAFKKTTISHYFSSSKCISCSKVAGTSVCRQCEHKPQRLALILGNMINQWQRKHNNVAKICRSCCARNEPIGCSSLDCPVYYLFRQTAQDAEQVRYAENLKREYLYF